MPYWLIFLLVCIAGIALMILFGAEHLSPYARRQPRRSIDISRENPRASAPYDPVYLQRQEAMQASPRKE